MNLLVKFPCLKELFWTEPNINGEDVVCCLENVQLKQFEYIMEKLTIQEEEKSQEEQILVFIDGAERC